MKKHNEKLLIMRTVYEDSRDAKRYNPFKWKDIKHFQFEDDDVITIGFEEGKSFGDSSYPDMFIVHVERPILETDEEFKVRMEEREEQSKKMKEDRYNLYLRLKREFETDK